MSGNVQFAGDQQAVRQFFTTCRNLGLRRAAREAKRQADGDYWTVEEWQAWVRRGRAAFGDSPKALFGQLTLIEAMLDSDMTAPQIHHELAVIDANRAKAEAAKEARAEAETRKAEKARQDAEVEIEVRKQMVRIEAKKRVDDLSEQSGIARPRRVPSGLVTVKP